MTGDACERDDKKCCPAIRVMAMPRDTNAYGAIFGGVILSYIDQAGAIEAMRHTPHRVVTIAMKGVEFHQPVHVGDVLSLYTHLERIGKTSITVSVKVDADRYGEMGVVVPVTSATVTYVAVDEYGRPINVRDEPPTEDPLNYVI